MPMVSCAVRSCRNRNGVHYKKTTGITFHKFPLQDSVRLKIWSDFASVNRPNWKPTKYSVLCIRHFKEEFVDRTSLVCVRLRPNAVPTLGGSPVMSDLVVKCEQSPSPESPEPPLSPTKKIKSEEECGSMEINCEEIKTEEIHVKEEIIEEPSTSNVETGEKQINWGFLMSNLETKSEDDLSKKLENWMEQMRPKQKVKVVKGQKVEVTDNHILQFNIHLMRGRGAPKVWRRFQVPATYTFREFHIAIQKAMGWKSIHFDYHLHSFSAVNPATGYKDYIVMPEDIPNYAEYENPRDENQTKIKDYFYILKHKGKYLYDFGCCWEHEFVFEKALLPVEGEKYPKCVEGAKACPLEDGNEPSDEEYDSDEFNPEACFED